MKKENEEVPTVETGGQTVTKPVSTTSLTLGIIGRFCDVVINLLLFSTFVNPMVPHSLYWVAGIAGVGYVLFSGPLAQNGNAICSWDAEHKKMRSLHWRKVEYTRAGFTFVTLHALLRAVGSFWLFCYCVSAAYSR